MQCVDCNGSGYYDHNGSPPCGACDGTGEEPDIIPPPEMTCRLCLEPQRFAIRDLVSERWLPGYCDRHGEALLQALTTQVQDIGSVQKKI